MANQWKTIKSPFLYWFSVRKLLIISRGPKCRSAFSRTCLSGVCERGKTLKEGSANYLYRHPEVPRNVLRGAAKYFHILFVRSQSLFIPLNYHRLENPEKR